MVVLFNDFVNICMTHSRENKHPIILSDLKNESTYKSLFIGIAGWLKGNGTNGINLKGTEQQIHVVQEAMTASKTFQEELSRPVATLNSVVHKLDLKHTTASNFEKVLGVPWLL